MTCRAARLRVLAAACALLAAAGAAVLDDYGVSTDESAQRRIVKSNWRYIADGGEFRIDRAFYDVDRFYGMAFELPLLLAEKALGVDDARGVHLLRHAAGYVLFLAGALSCALLARRMTGSTAIALLALALFALQPRIYAHAFFNSKDVPALALFAVCLWLAHRAFRRGGAGAFLLCGAGVAVLANLRLPAGLALAAAVLAARVLDLALASGAAARRRVLSAIAAFAAAGAGVFYATSPWMWVDGPAALIDAVERFSYHPNKVPVLVSGAGPSSPGPAGALLPGVVRGLDAAGPAGPRPRRVRPRGAARPRPAGRRLAQHAGAFRPPARRVLGPGRSWPSRSPAPTPMTAGATCSSSTRRSASSPLSAPPRPHAPPGASREEGARPRSARWRERAPRRRPRPSFSSTRTSRSISTAWRTGRRRGASASVTISAIMGPRSAPASNARSPDDRARTSASAAPRAAI